MFPTFPRPWAIVSAAIAFAALLIFRATGADSAASLSQLSADPYTNSGAEHQTEVEPGVFGFGSTIVAAFQEGRFRNGGATDIGFASSHNAGLTWTSGSLPGITTANGGTYPTATNPAVAFDAAHGAWLIESNALNASLAGVALVVNRSTDGGVSWSNPVTLAAATGSQSWDKPGITCDNTAASPYYGHCYAQWDDNSGSQLIYLSTSTDGGLTWAPAIHTADLATGFGGQPVVQPNGTVVVPFANSAQTAMLSFTSTNGGVSWSATTSIVTGIQTHAAAGGLRMYTLPSGAIDGAGNVYVVWQECNFEASCSANDLVLVTSANGTLWSSVQRIPADPVGSGTEHVLPGLAVDPATSGASAHLALEFYHYPVANCSFATCQLDVGFVSSTNGGATWTPQTRIAGPMTLAQLAPTNQGPMVGDYMTAAIANGLAFPMFAVGNPPTIGIYNEAIFTVYGGLPIGTSPQPRPIYLPEIHK